MSQKRGLRICETIGYCVLMILVAYTGTYTSCIRLINARNYQPAPFGSRFPMSTGICIYLSLSM